MGFINVALDDVNEAQAVEEGEYDLRVIKVEDKESKKGNPMTVVTIKIEDSPIPNASLVRHFLVYPSADTPADQRQMRLLEIKRFLHAFGVPFEGGGFESEDLIGQTARCLLKQEEADGGGIFNKVVAPRLNER